MKRYRGMIHDTHISTLLRTALLLGAISFVNVQHAQAQPVSLTADMPDAFETKVPVAGEYYYVQFYMEINLSPYLFQSFLGEAGEGANMHAMDYLPYANNRQWTLETVGNGKYKLKSKRGYYAYAVNTGTEAEPKYYFRSTQNSGQASEFQLVERSSLRQGYYELKVSENLNLSRESKNDETHQCNNYEWGDIIGYKNNESRNIVRFAKLKPTAAHIIYYREEHSDGYDNAQYRANEATTRHYLTYSGTDASAKKSAVSSRKSIIPKDKSLWTLPTAAAYHQDGLWALEEAENDGEFYIKRYGTEQYMNASMQSDGHFISDLGKKDAFYGKYKLADANANRYSLIQNIKYATGTLTSSMFSGPAPVDFNVGNDATLNPGATIAGTGTVDYQTYADLSGYTKMIVNGTADMQLRVLMNRQIGPSGNESEGPYVEKIVTIGSDGKAVVDLTYLELNTSTTGSASVKMTYVNGSDANVNTSYGGTDGVQTGSCGYNRISNGIVELGNKSWGVNDIIYLKVDASALSSLGKISKVTLKATASGSNDGKRSTFWGAGYNNSEWSPNLTWNTANRSITNLTENLVEVTKNTTREIALDITEAFTNDPDKIATILVYETAAGGGTFTNPTVEVEYYPTFSYCHLNAIKTGWGSPSGIINSITLLNENNLTPATPLTLHYDTGEGRHVPLWENQYDDRWYAAFYPVEVPVPNKDNFFQVLVGLTSTPITQMVGYNGWAAAYSEIEGERILWQLEQVDDYKFFRLKNPNNGSYLAGRGMVTEPNDPNGESHEGANKAEIYTNQKFWSDFSLKWFLPAAVAEKEILIDHYVKHKESYLRAYADKNVIPDQEGLKKQGLSRDIDSDWWNFDGNGFDSQKGTQNTNHFEITHYLKKGNSRVIEFPTVLNHNNDHVLFQRFYNYGELDEHMDLDNLKAHVSLDTPNDGNVQYFLYRNGMVTGQKLDWTNVEDGGYARNEQRRFNYTNSDGERFTVAVDVSRYSDLEYVNKTAHLEGDLIEPSLTMRYLFYMRDAKEMAAQLTACQEGNGKWLESKEFHYGRTQVPYTKFKKVGYRGEFIGLRHVFSDYWVYDDPRLADDTYLASLKTSLNMSEEALNDYLDQHLVSAVNDNESGKIEVEVIPGNTGIRKGGYNPNINLNSEEAGEGNDADYQGFYFYDLLSPSPKHEYGNSRFVVFRYPEADENGIVQVANCGPDNPAYVRVYLNNGGQRYQLAEYKIIFDANMATRPWTQLNNGTSYANGVNQVKDTNRDPNQLRARAGKPIAKITFDFPQTTTYHFPSVYDSNSTDGKTRHHQGDHEPGGTIANSSPVPLTFDHTNYSFDGDYCNWGSYAMVTTMETHYGNQKIIMPADDNTYGYGIDADPGMQKAFLYIDASEQPGDICAVEFEGDFCANDQLMCTGWISGSNKIRGDTRCPGSITLTVKGEDAYGNTNTIYRFCPGQIYELDNGYEKPGGDVENAAGIDGNGNGADHVVWQQFYFEFSTDKKYERYWLEVNNNCVSSNGGDFMLDNVEVYTIVPEVLPDINTPLCVQRDGTSEMRLLKLNVDYNKLLSSVTKQGETSETPYLGLVFLEKEKFLTTLRQELGETGVSLDVMAERVASGYYDNTIDGSDEHYQNAFNAALLRKNNSTAIWKSDDRNNNKGAGVMYFKWGKTFANDDIQPVYTFANAVAKTSAVYRTTEGGVDYIVLNGNYPELPWKTNTDYYIVPSNTYITDFSNVYDAFNICSQCSKATTFQIEPPYKILSMESTDITDDYAFCEGKIPTLLVDLKGYTTTGEQTLIKDLNYDWWLGSNNMKATLENYHSATNAAGTVKLDEALYAFRYYYPGVTSVEGITEQLTQKPYLSKEMIYFLQELVNKGELVLHQKSISIPSLKTSTDDPYFYLVACPIYDADFHNAIGSSAYFCEEPQGLRMKVGDKAPGLKTGFVPDENGFPTYNYPSGNLTLSLRLAKMAQFETVKHDVEPTAATETWEGSSNKFLWLPLRDAKVQTGESTKVIQKSDDDNIYLASTDDPEWDKAIYTAMSKVDNQNKPIGALPIVGKIVQLNAIDKSKEANASLAEKDQNRLCVYFTKNFEVREGYNYTLSLPFREAPATNTCDGTILLHLKIVPDYEVWTGGAGNTDWNNDQNWRRADGNQAIPTAESTDGSALNNNELLVSGDLPATSGLKDYTTNYANYRTAKDRLLRKGFAPLYCTHILMKSNEWGDAPVLFDALNGKDALDAAPFPNLSETYEVNTVEYSIGEGDRYTSIETIGENSFAIVNETESKAFYGSNAQNLGYGSYEAAMQYTNSGFYFKLERAQNVTDENNNPIDGDLYHLILQTPGGENYSVWGKPGYLNSQPLSGSVSFILGLNGQNGQDLKNGAVWKLEESGGKFALKNVGTGKYLKDNSNAKYDPTYFTFCKLQGETISSSSEVRANVLKYDIQAREYSIWKDTYGSDPDKGRAGDLIAEMYQINSCDEIALQPSAELLNAHLLNYNNAWVEYQLDMNRWYLLGSPLQGTIAGEWYAPTGTAQQKTTYYEPVTFGEGYDRYSPAIYQRSWDKAKAVLYEVGSEYNKNDDSQTENLGTPLQGKWNNGTWNTTGADNYLDRLGYKPMSGNKANVAIKGVWSNTYNDATVDYATGGYSVMVKNDLKGGSNANPAIIRLPKEDTMYDYYRFEETGADSGGTDTDLTGDNGVQTQKGRAKNRGRLKTDLLLPVSDTSLPTYQKIQRTEATNSRYGDKRTYTRVPTQKGTNALPMTLRNIEETVSAGSSNLGYYLVENPFPCGMNMNQFFTENSGLEKKYWLLTAGGQQLVQWADNQWVSPNGTAFDAAEAIVAPGQGFFVQATTPGQATTITFNEAMQAKSRYGVKNGTTKLTIVVGTKLVGEEIQDVTNTVEINKYEQNDNQQYPLKAPRTRAAERETAHPLGMVITAQRDDMKSSALVMKREGATNDFLPTEDTETFLNSDLKQVPTVYTLCGRLATTINSIHDFRSLPVGVESNSSSPCTLTFRGVETLGDSIAFYDAVEQKLTPLESGMQFTVSGQTQNRYYLVTSLNQEKVAEETHLQIFTVGLLAKVIASTAEPILHVRCFDLGGRQVHMASPKSPEYSFNLPAAGVYIIEAETENDHKVMKVMAK